MYNVHVVFDWDEKKNEELKREGRPCFEDATRALQDNPLLVNDVNPAHAGQWIFVVEIAGYPHVIPYEIRGEIYWLITVYPARKYKR